MSAANVENKGLKYIRQGTGTAEAKASGAALKRQAEELSRIGKGKDTALETGKPAAAPGTAASPSSVPPAANSFRAFSALRIGGGQLSPFASSVL